LVILPRDPLKRETDQMSIGRGSAIVLLALAAVFATGCGETQLDDVKTEDTLEQSLQRSSGLKVSAVECPSGVEVEKGTTFECTVSLAGGDEEIATLKILNDDADVSLVDLQPAGGQSSK
jgi:Domain of unknown function (DUF4333)